MDKRKLKIITVFILLILFNLKFFTLSKNQKRNIVFAYNNINNNSKIKMSNGKWKLKYKKQKGIYEWLKLKVVDIANGYIETKYSSIYTHTKDMYTLFRDIKKRYLLVHSTVSNEGYHYNFHKPTINFYMYGNGRLKQVYHIEFPSLSGDDFLYSEKIQQAKSKTNNYAVYYKLPRYGTDIKAYLMIPYCMVPNSMKQYEYAKKNYVKYRSIIIGFNSRFMKFYVKRKVM